MNQPIERPCPVCSDHVDPNVGHQVHEDDCPNSSIHRVVVDCACDLFAHPECCPAPECIALREVGELSVHLARSTWLLGYIAKRLVLQPDGTATVLLSAGTADALKAYRPSKPDED